MIEGLAGLTAANLSDSLDSVGLRHQVLADRLCSVIPGSRVIGRARTARFAPTEVLDPQAPYSAAIDFIDSVAPGDLIVIATNRSNASAFWGELFSAAALGRGAVGMITDGNLRDGDRIGLLQFPAFARSSRPIDYRGRMELVAVQQTVVVGGVAIDPGDLVLADDDGVVVVPAAAEEAVLNAARVRMNVESTVLAELIGGATLRKVWERYHIL